MDSPESNKPIPPAALPKRARKKRKKKAEPAPKPRHLTIIKSSAEREEIESGDKSQTAAEYSHLEDIKHRFFQKTITLRPADGSTPRHPRRRRRRRRSRSRLLARLHLVRFHLKFGFRKFRLFHRRFTLRQILWFYIGIPAGISLFFCLGLLFMKPPKGVTPTTVSSRKPPATELLQQIQWGLKAKDADAVQSALEGLEKYYPKDPRTPVAQGTVFAHAKKYDEAREAYFHALDLVPNLPPALINLGEVEFAVGNYGQAAKYYDRAAEKIPRNTLVLFRRYLCYSLLNDRPRAESLLGELAAAPYSVEWYFIQASEAVRAGKDAEAQRFISTAMTLFGEQASAYQESLKKIGWLK